MKQRLRASEPAASGAILCGCFTHGCLYCCDVFELSCLWLLTSACFFFCDCAFEPIREKTAQEKSLRKDEAEESE